MALRCARGGGSAQLLWISPLDLQLNGALLALEDSAERVGAKGLPRHAHEKQGLALEEAVVPNLHALGAGAETPCAWEVRTARQAPQVADGPNGRAVGERAAAG